MNIGIDTVYIPEFIKRITTPEILESTFTQEELAVHTTEQSRAGIFAAKEAYMKALGKKIDWHDVWVEKQPNGQPVLRSIHTQNSVSVSITHEHEYAMAVVIIE